MDIYHIRPMRPVDLSLVNRWLETPPVRQWWVDASGQPSDPFDQSDLADPNVALWIVSHEGRPFAFIQDYDPHAWTDHHFADLAPGSRGIDQFIGAPDMIGRGHGSAFIRLHCQTLMAAGAPTIGTDPHPANARAIRAYEKAGFTRGKEVSTQWGDCLLMTCASPQMSPLFAPRHP